MSTAADSGERVRRMPLGLVQRVRQQPQHRQAARTGEAVHLGVEDLQGRLRVDWVCLLAAGADEEQISETETTGPILWRVECRGGRRCAAGPGDRSV